MFEERRFEFEKAIKEYESLSDLFSAELLKRNCARQIYREELIKQFIFQKKKKKIIVGIISFAIVLLFVLGVFFYSKVRPTAAGITEEYVKYKFSLMESLVGISEYRLQERIREEKISGNTIFNCPGEFSVDSTNGYTWSVHWESTDTKTPPAGFDWASLCEIFVSVASERYGFDPYEEMVDGGGKIYNWTIEGKFDDVIGAVNIWCDEEYAISIWFSSVKGRAIRES